MKPFVMQFEVLDLLEGNVIVFILVKHLLGWHLRNCRVDKTVQVSIEFFDRGRVKKCVELSVAILKVGGAYRGVVSVFHRFCRENLHFGAYEMFLPQRV